MMRHGIVSLVDVWREWSQGFCRGPAVMDLEHRYRTRWREDAAVKRFFLRRNGVVKVIQDYAKSNQMDTKTAVTIAKKRRVANKRSIHWLSDNKHEIFGSS
ncbi:transcriptional activator of glycolytic enzymes-domain-containing protein [Mucor lusitanicus]|uniref:Transcriptional activator of glycolytic enzymes-domain-containing protein n=1 Tax=Mucor circinelloides f. lusitanicus TaxID=29924 RepID=A0A8H4F029_MUCCL|nr:transcriptional activator of glycolytic enzymes-domain-containing protein [Mucor lusitanicus]